MNTLPAWAAPAQRRSAATPRRSERQSAPPCRAGPVETLRSILVADMSLLSAIRPQPNLHREKHLRPKLLSAPLPARLPLGRTAHSARAGACDRLAAPTRGRLGAGH